MEDAGGSSPTLPPLFLSLRRTKHSGERGLWWHLAAATVSSEASTAAMVSAVVDGGLSSSVSGVVQRIEQRRSKVAEHLGGLGIPATLFRSASGSSSGRSERLPLLRAVCEQSTGSLFAGVFSLISAAAIPHSDDVGRKLIVVARSVVPSQLSSSSDLLFPQSSSLSSRPAEGLHSETEAKGWENREGEELTKIWEKETVKQPPLLKLVAVVGSAVPPARRR
nr:hypothetical protein Iba_chr10cCG9590 [Ipomoea batatas]